VGKRTLFDWLHIVVSQTFWKLHSLGLDPVVGLEAHSVVAFPDDLVA
jgi:hypothetical protein